MACLFDALEARQLLANLLWDGGGDGRSWMDPLNWSTDAIPTGVDTVLIPGSGENGTEPLGALRLSLEGIREPIAALRAERGVQLMGGALGVRGDAEFGRGLIVDADASIQAQAVRVHGAINGFAQINGTIRSARVELDAGRDSVLVIRGTIDASSESGPGGWAQLLGWQVVMQGATVDASGATGGGTVLIGGEQAGVDTLPRASATYLNGATTVRADAREAGNGGRVIVWADDFTGFFGTISARGGAQGGNGGFVETSAKDKLQVAGAVDASAPNGAAGAWLLDPRNISITSGGNDNVTFSGTDPVIVTATTSSGFVSVAFLNSGLSGGTSVTIRTSGSGLSAGNITLAAGAAISKTAGGSCTLRLEATNDIILNSTISDSSIGSLNIFLTANDQVQGGDLNIAAGSVTINSAINTGGGSLTITGIGATIAANLTITGGLSVTVGTGGVALSDIVNTGGSTFNLTSAGTVSQSAPSTIATGGLRLAGTGAITLFQSNAITTFAASMTGSGTFTVGVSGAITVGTVLGTVGVTTGGGNAVFGTGTGALTITEAVNVGAGTFAGELGAGIALSGNGSITAGGLGILSAVAINLTSNVSASTVALLTVGGASITYAQIGSFTVGPVIGASGINSSNGNVTLTSGGSISLARVISAGTGTVSITTASGITQTSAGVITAAGLAVQGAGAASLETANNNVGTLAANLTGSAQLRYFDVDSLTVGTVSGVVGATTASDPIQISSGGPLSIASPLNSGSATMVLLASDIAISATITCNSTLVIDLTSGMGSIGLGSGAGSMNISAAEFGFINAEILTIGGFTSFVAITTSAMNFSTRPFALRLFGSTVATGGITMNPTRGLTILAGSVSQTGAIIAGDLALQISSSSTLTNAGNDVDRLGFEFGSDATFTFADLNGFQIGSMGVGGDLGEFSSANLTAGAGGAVVIASTINGSGGAAVTINAPGGVTSAGGLITLSTVHFTGGSVNLPGNNDADVLTFSLTSGSAMTWTDADDLTVNTSTTSGGPVTLTVPNLSILGTLSASGAVVTLNSSVDCDTVESGRISAGSLLVRGGNVDQEFFLNTTITNFASDASAGITVVESSGLVITTVGGVAGVTLPNRDLVLDVGGSISILAPISLGTGDLYLDAGGSATQGVSGSIACDMVFVSTTGATTLTNGDNAVGRLDGSSAGAIALTTSIDLIVGQGDSTLDATSLTILSAGSISVISSLSCTGVVLLHAGTDGSGNLTISSGRLVNSSSTSLRAGDGAGGTDTGTITLAGVQFQGPGGGVTSPGSFTLRQDASIADASLLTAGQFSAGIAGMALTYQSDAGQITHATAAKLNGANVTLASGAGTNLNVTFTPASLVVTGPASSSAGSITATTNITFGGALVLNASLTLGGTNVTLSNVNGNVAGLRALAVNASGVTAFGGTVGGTTVLSSVTTNAAGSVLFGGSVFTNGAQTYNEATLSLTGPTTLSAGGDLTFAPLSTLSAGTNSLSLRAAEVNVSGTLDGTGALAFEAATAGQGLTIGATSVANLDLTAAELARIGNTWTSMTFGRADGTGQVVVGSATTLTNPATFMAPGVGGSIIVNAVLSGSGDASFTFVGSGATTTLSADVRTAGAPITFNDSVIIANPTIAIDTTNGGAVPAGASITFNFGVNGQTAGVNGLTVTAGSSTVFFNAAVGQTVPLATLTSSSLTRLSGTSYNTTGAQSYLGQVVLTGPSDLSTFVSAGGGATFSSSINGLGGGVQSLSIIGNAIFNGPIGGGAALAGLSVSGTAQIGTTSIATTSSGGGSGSQVYFGAVILATANDTTVTFAAGGASVLFMSTVNAAAAGEQGITIASGAVEFRGAAGGVNALRAITAGVGRVDGTLATTTAGGGTGDATFSGLVTLGGASGSTALLASFGGSVRLNGGVQATAPGQQGLGVSGHLLLGAAGVPVALRQLDVSGTASLGGGTIRTSSVGGGSGSQTLTGAVTLTGATTFDATGTVNFASTVGAGANAATIRAGEAIFGGNISGTASLTIEPSVATTGMLIGGSDGPGGAFDLSAVSIGRIVNGFAAITLGRSDGSGTVSIAAPVSFNDPVTFRAPTGAGRVQVNGLLTGLGNTTFAFESAQPVILNAGIRTTGQAITFGGAVLIGASSVTIDATNAGSAPAGAAVTFSAAVNSEAAENNGLVVVSGTTGLTTFAAPVGATQALSNLSTDAGGALSMVGATTTGTQSYSDGTISIRGDFAAGGGITFNGAVTLTGNTTITTGGGPVNFNNTVNGPFALVVNTAGAVTLNAAVGAISPLQSFGSNPGGTLLASSIATTGALQALDSIVTLNSGILSSSGGTIATSSGASVRLNGNTTIAAPVGQPALLAASIDGLIAGAGTLLLTGPATLTGQIGGQIPLGSFRATGATSVTGASITTTTAGGGLGRVMFDSAPAFLGTVALTAPGTGIDLPAGFTASTGVITLLGQLNLGGNASVTAGAVEVVMGAATTGGAITLGNTGAPVGVHVDAAEISRFANGFARLTFGRADGSGNVIVASALTFIDPVLLRAPVPPAQILVNGAITALDGIEFQGSGATVILNADVRTAGTPITFNDGVLVATNVIVDTTNNGAVGTGAAITFGTGFTLNSETGEANNLMLRGGTTGVTTLGGNVGMAVGGALGMLTTDAGGATVIGASVVNVVNAALFGDAVTFTASVDVSASVGVVTFASTFSGGAFDTRIVGSEIDFLGAVSGTGRIRLEPNVAGRNLNVAHPTEGGGDALDITKSELDLFAAGFEVIEFGKDDGSAILDFEEYTFDSSALLQMPGAGGSILVNGELACDTDGGSIGIRGTGSTTRLRAPITTRGGAITIEDSVIIETDGVFISTRRAERAGAPVTITGIINSLVLARRDLTITSGLGAITILGEVGGRTDGELGQLTLNGSGGINLFGPRIRTRGAQNYNGPVTLGPAVTLQNIGSPINFNGTLNGAGNLTIAPGSGATTFNGNVGGVTQLNALLINAGSTRIFNGPVAVGVLTVFGGTVEFNGTTAVGTGLLIAGTLGGSGNITFALPLTWVGGNMTGTGTTRIAQSGALVISGGPKTLSRAIVNEGAIYWTDGDVNFAGGSLTNQSTGQFFAQSDGQFIGVSGSNSLDNSGLIERSGTGASAFNNLNYSNRGDVNIVSGNLAVTPSGGTFTDAGTTTIAAGSAMLVTGNYTQTENARLNTTLANQATFGRITVTGTATLAGALGVTLDPDFPLPAPGTRFDIVTGATRVGQFSATFLPSIPGRNLDTLYGDDFAAIVVRSGADFNGDGTIDPDDLADFIAGFFGSPPDIRTDFNGDGVIDPDDLADFIAAFFGG